MEHITEAHEYSSLATEVWLPSGWYGMWTAEVSWIPTVRSNNPAKARPPLWRWDPWGSSAVTGLRRSLCLHLPPDAPWGAYRIFSTRAVWPDWLSDPTCPSISSSGVVMNWTNLSDLHLLHRLAQCLSESWQALLKQKPELIFSKASACLFTFLLTLGKFNQFLSYLLFFLYHRALSSLI